MLSSNSVIVTSVVATFTNAADWFAVILKKSKSSKDMFGKPVFVSISY